jgi:nucleotide-binding universal stress UspA family protein
MRVLISIDDSDCSKRAFESVLERIWPDDAHFRVITVVELVQQQYGLGCGYAEPIYAAQCDYVKHCREMIDEKIVQLQKTFANSTVTGEVLEGNIPGCIVSDASEYGADLLVVGTHGRKGFEKVFLGSVAERVAAHSPCSVEIIKQKLKPAVESTNHAKSAALV